MKSLLAEQANSYRTGDEALGTTYAQVPTIALSPRLADRGAESPQSVIPNRRRFIHVAGLVKWLDNALPLPDSRRSFGVYLLGLLIVIMGMLTHVLLSAQILQSQVELAALKEQHSNIERETGEVLWEIGRTINLQHVEERAKAAGYIPITQREYVGVRMAEAPTPSNRVDDANANEAAPIAVSPDVTANGTQDSGPGQYSPESDSSESRGVISVRQSTPDGTFTYSPFQFLQQWRTIFAASDATREEITARRAAQTGDQDIWRLWRSKEWADNVAEWFEETMGQ